MVSYISELQSDATMSVGRVQVILYEFSDTFYFEKYDYFNNVLALGGRPTKMGT